MATEGKEVEFVAGGRSAHGYLALPAGPGPVPAVIVIQEWWGLTDHIKDIAGRFAAKGYAALAPDLYYGRVTKDAGEAGQLMQGLDQKKALATLDAAVDYLSAQPGVDATRIGVTGFCMGGTYALLMAANNRHIKAAAPFYGDVPAADVLERLAAPVLFFGAEQDQWITMEKIGRLQEGLKKYGKTGEVKVYKGVGHAFFNDTRPEAYDKAAAEDAWSRVTQFFAVHLRK